MTLAIGILCALIASFLLWLSLRTKTGKKEINNSKHLNSKEEFLKSHKVKEHRIKCWEAILEKRRDKHS